MRFQDFIPSSHFKHPPLIDAHCSPLSQAWTVAHPPRRGLICLGTRPLVHKGFLTAWSEVADRVSEAVQEVLEGLTERQREAFQVLVTGLLPLALRFLLIISHDLWIAVLSAPDWHECFDSESSLK